MLAKPVNPNKLPVGLLVLFSLLIFLFLVPKFDSWMQQTVASEPPPPSRVLDVETERRFTNMQADVDEALYLVKKLHYIYGIELPTCEGAASSANYHRCLEQRREYLSQMEAIKRYRELEQNTNTQAIRRPAP